MATYNQILLVPYFPEILNHNEQVLGLNDKSVGNHKLIVIPLGGGGKALEGSLDLRTSACSIWATHESLLDCLLTQCACRCDGTSGTSQQSGRENTRSPPSFAGGGYEAH